MTTTEKPLPLGGRQDVSESEKAQRVRKEYPTVEDMVEEPESDPNIIRGRE